MIGTDGLEDKLQQILNDPDSMAQIMSLAQSLGGSQQEEQSPVSPPTPPIDEGMMQAMMGLMQQARQTDSRQEALLAALKPYLAPERREKIDRAMQLAKISRIAGSALRNYGGLFGKQGG